MDMTPDDRKYTKTHEWIRMEGEDEAVVGITDYAQDALGDITFVELPEVGQAVERGDECGVIESVKAATDLYAPVNGEVSEINNHLDNEPEIINRDPYDDGWIYRLRHIDPDEVEDLMDAAAYEATLEEQEEE